MHTWTLDASQHFNVLVCKCSVRTPERVSTLRKILVCDRCRYSRSQHCIVFLFVTEVQARLDAERRERAAAEERLLAAEKRSSDVSVDLAQLQSQVAALKADLRAENDKVSAVWRAHAWNWEVQTVKAGRPPRQKKIELH